MPGTSQIKWSSADLEKVRRAVLNFNRRLDYWKKKNPESAETLPHKLSYKEVRDAIKTRKDLQREIREIESFKPSKLKSKDYMEVGLAKTTKWEYKRAKRKMEAANKLRAEAAERMRQRKAYVNGEEYEPVESKMLKQKSKPLTMPKLSKPAKPGITEIPKQQQWKNFARAMEREAARTYKRTAQQHIKLLKQAILSDQAGYNNRQRTELIKYLNRLDPETVLKAYYAGREEVDSDYQYHDPTDGDKKYKKTIKYFRELLGRGSRFKDQLINAIRANSLIKPGQKGYLVRLLNEWSSDHLEELADETGAKELDPEHVEFTSDYEGLKNYYQNIRG
jgi:hypothetical protein